jgi:hypothetical protein
VETPEAMQQMKEELAQQFAGWQHIQSLLECELAVAIRVSHKAALQISGWVVIWE